MVIALFALSLLMIVGGVAAVVQGFPYVRLESGLAMVIGGTTAASAGAVLLGLAAAMLQMKKLANALASRGPGEARVPAFPDPITASDEARPISAGAAAATAGAAGLAGIGLGGMRDRLGTGSARTAADPSFDAEPPLPDLLPPAIPEPDSSGPIVADEDLFALPEDRPGHGPRTLADAPVVGVSEPDPAQEELALRPALDDAATAPDAIPSAPFETPVSAEPEAAPEEAKPKAEELQVVGTYASGANTYVMFANGTIQADTPQGQFTFQSLDELKVFVDSGGETAARGAA